MNMQQIQIRPYCEEPESNGHQPIALSEISDYAECAYCLERVVDKCSECPRHWYSGWVTYKQNLKNHKAHA